MDLFSRYYVGAIKKYATFTGRASRADYWYFVLFNALIALALGIIGAVIGVGSEALINLYSFVTLLPLIALAVRRMHDVNKSGWYILIPIYNLVLYLTAGKKGANEYGEDPYAKQTPEAMTS